MFQKDPASKLDTDYCLSDKYFHKTGNLMDQEFRRRAIRAPITGQTYFRSFREIKYSDFSSD